MQPDTYENWSAEQRAAVKELLVPGADFATVIVTTLVLLAVLFGPVLIMIPHL
jgi:hypothetical protein